jgi:hypothetical protein
MGPFRYCEERSDETTQGPSHVAPGLLRLRLAMTTYRHCERSEAIHLSTRLALDAFTMPVVSPLFLRLAASTNGER